MPFFLFILFAVFALCVAFWLVTLPFRILFGLLFGLGGALLRLLLAPLMLLVVGLVLFALLLAAVVAVLVPLVPIALLGLATWAIFRAMTRRSVPAV
jgi:hypothetical protein